MLIAQAAVVQPHRARVEGRAGQAVGLPEGGQPGRQLGIQAECLFPLRLRAIDRGVRLALKRSFPAPLDRWRVPFDELSARYGFEHVRARLSPSPRALSRAAESGRLGDGRAVLGPHIGDLDALPVFEAFRE